MKGAIFAAGLAVLAFVSFAASQSVVVTPRKVVYKRPKPTSAYKKTFAVIYPKVKAATPALSARIESAINPVTVLGVNIEEERNDIQWMEEASYEVNYNKNGILNVKLYMFGSAAYPDGTSKLVSVDIKTGKPIEPADLFTDLKGLAAFVKKAQTKEIQAGKLELKKDPEMEETTINDLFENTDFTIVNLKDFSISDAGITFEYDYAFPHVIQALQPDGTFLVKWDELKPFIKRPGLLARFVR